MKTTRWKQRVLCLALGCLFPAGTIAAETVSNNATHPSMAIMQKQAGDKFLRAGQIEDAMKAYQKAVRSNPKLSRAWFNLAIACYAKCNLEGARKALKEVIRTNPEDAEARYNLACVRLYQGDIDQARFQLDKASHCPNADSLVDEQINKAQTYLDFFQTCTTTQRQQMLKLLGDGLEPIGSASPNRT